MTVCRKCRKPARDHCPACMVCRPASNEHPYWCDAGDSNQDED